MISELTTSSCLVGGSDSAAERQRLATILDEYLLEIERGAPVEPEELLARHPDVADRLRGYLSGLALFHKAAAAPVSGGRETQSLLFVENWVEELKQRVPTN